MQWEQQKERSPVNAKETQQSKFDQLFKDEYAVILLQGKNTTGTSIYSYVKVTLPNIKRLYAALNSGKDFSPGDFGTILAEGEGVPSDELRAEMKAIDGGSLQPIAPTVFRPTTIPPHTE